MTQTHKQTILDAFDRAMKAIPDPEAMYAVGFIVVMTGKSACDMILASEAVIIDECNLERKRNYLAEKLDDDGYYIGTDKTVKVGEVFSGYLDLISEKLREAMEDIYH